MRYLLVLLAAVALAAPLAAFADKPPDPYIAATPNPVVAYSSYTITGCNYRPGTNVQVTIDRGTSFPTQEIGESGCLVPIVWWAAGPGSNLIEANKYPACGSGAYGHSAGAKCGLLADVVLEVIP